MGLFGCIPISDLPYCFPITSCSAERECEEVDAHVACVVLGSHEGEPFESMTQRSGAADLARFRMNLRQRLSLGGRAGTALHPSFSRIDAAQTGWSWNWNAEDLPCDDQ
jgi:hypothetical protein